MWQCDNCGYTDEDGTTFEEEVGESSEEAVRYCPECGSDEVFLVEEEDDPVPIDDAEDEEEELDSWESNGDGDEDEDEAEEW